MTSVVRSWMKCVLVLNSLNNFMHNIEKLSDTLLTQHGIHKTELNSTHSVFYNLTLA